METMIELTQEEMVAEADLPQEFKIEEVPPCDCGMWALEREEHGVTCSYRWWLNLEFYREGLHLP